MPNSPSPPKGMICSFASAMGGLIVRVQAFCLQALCVDRQIEAFTG